MIVNRFALLTLACATLLSTACTSSSSHRMAQNNVTNIEPAAGIEQIISEPIAVNVAAIDVKTEYIPRSHPQDISSSFPMPPDMVLRRHIQDHFQASGTSDILKFVIEDARVHHKTTEHENAVAKWLQMGRSDEYKILIKLRLYQETDDGTQGEHSILTFEKLFSMPASVSLAEREDVQMRNVHHMMADINRAIVKQLEEKLFVAHNNVVDDPNRNAFVYSLLSAPELRR